MALNETRNVTVGKPKVGGAIFRAPHGTTVPTNATEPLSDAFENVGYITEDGVVNSNSKDTENVKAWGGDTVLTTLTDVTDTWQFSLLETLSKTANQFRYGSKNVSGEGTVDDNLVIRSNNSQAEIETIVIEMIFSNNAFCRVVIEKGQITETEDITYVDGEAVAYGVTVTALPGSDGDTHKKYIVTNSGDVSE